MPSFHAGGLSEGVRSTSLSGGLGAEIAPLCWIVIAAVGYAGPRCDKGPPGKAAPSLD
jgi:hypothetical protein